MRLMLLDWMMEVSDEFGLSRETFHLSITYVDLYLTRMRCKIEELQLLGAASLLLACKVEEIVCPRVSHFTYATDNGFTHAQIVSMEAQISQVIAFHLTLTRSWAFSSSPRLWGTGLITSWLSGTYM